MGKRAKDFPDYISQSCNLQEGSGNNLQWMTCVEIGKALTSTFNMDQILVIFLQRVSELIRAKNWTLFLLDTDTRELYFEVVVGLDKQALGDVRIKVGEGLAGAVALAGEPVLVQDVQSDPRFSNRVDGMTGFVTRSLICLPLMAQGSVIGVIEVVNPEDPTLFEPESMPILSVVADYVAIAIINARNFKRIESLSVTDDVTGFYNTRFLHQHLDSLLQPGPQQMDEVSLVFLDMDNFKLVVDTHGHLMGSKVLKEVAETMTGALGEKDKLVRYGGDEFVIILPGQSKQTALEKIRAVQSALTDAVFLRDEGIGVKVTASFGVANYPHDAESKRDLLHIADHSMYRSKERGKDSITLAGTETTIGRQGRLI